MAQEEARDDLDKHEAKESQQHYLELLSSAAERLRSAMGQQAAPNSEDDAVKVITGSTEIYDHSTGVAKADAQPYRPPTRQQLDKLQKALNDPQQVEGSVKLKVGNETAYKVRDGEVEVDKYGLQPQQQQQRSAGRELSLNERVERLEQRVVQLDERMERLEQKLDNLQPRRPAVQNQQLNQFLQRTSSQIAQTIGESRDRIMEAARNFKQNLSDRLQQLKQGAAEQANRAKQGVRDFAAARVVQQVELLLDRTSNRTAEGNPYLETGSGYHFEKQGNTISISAPERGEVVRAEGKAPDRQVNVSQNIQDQDKAKLEQAGNQIERDLQPKQSQAQQQRQSQGARR